jgi:hypothetical protein
MSHIESPVAREKDSEAPSNAHPPTRTGSPRWARVSLVLGVLALAIFVLALLAPTHERGD